MKPFQLPALLLTMSCAQSPAQNDQVASRPAGPSSSEEQTRVELMDRIERVVRLPPGAGRLASYERSYAWQQRADGVRKVAGVYLSPEGSHRGRRWVAAERELPQIVDGGCSMISLTFDVATQLIEHIACNGEA